MAPPPDPFVGQRENVPPGAGEQVVDKGFPVYVRIDGEFHRVLHGPNGAFYENDGRQHSIYQTSDGHPFRLYRFQGDDPNQPGQQPYYEEADSDRILDAVSKSTDNSAGREGGPQWNPDRITRDAVERTVDPRTVTSPGTGGTNDLGRIQKPGSFTGAVASASSAKLAEIHQVMTRINKDVHDTLLDAALLKARTKDYNIRYNYLTWLITDTRAKMNQLPIGDTETRTQAQAYIDHQQQQLDSARTLFTAYLTRLSAISNKANNPDDGVDKRGRERTPPPVVRSPQGTPQGTPQVTPTPQGADTTPRPETTTPGTTTTDPTARTTNTTSRKTAADDILSKLQQNGQPVGTTTPQQQTPVTGTPAMMPMRQQGQPGSTTGVPATYTPGAPGSTTGQPMSDNAFNNLLSQIKSRNNTGTPSTEIPTTTTSVDSPTTTPGTVPVSQPSSVPNLSTAGTKTTATSPSGTPSGGDGNGNRPMGTGMPVMPMAPMMGAPGAGGQGNRKAGESSVKSEQDLGERLGGPVPTTTPVINDKKNKNVAPADDSPTSSRT